MKELHECVLTAPLACHYQKRLDCGGIETYCSNQQLTDLMTNKDIPRPETCQFRRVWKLDDTADKVVKP